MFIWRFSFVQAADYREKNGAAKAALLSLRRFCEDPAGDFYENEPSRAWH
jgi:hypothetical protein